MKITEIKSFLLTAPRDLHIVKVETDAGIHGLGEAGCSTREFGQDGILRHFREFLRGMDPFRIEHIWQTLYRSPYYEGGRVIAAVISAIDMALYDIAGKALGVPVYQLLGGACRDRIYGFATAGSLSAPGCLEEALKLAGDGWPAIRFGPADPKNSVAVSRTFDAWASIAETAEAFTAAREQIDRRIPLGIDYHHRLSVAEAASFCQMIPRGSLAFLEEPIRCETPDAYAALRTMTDVPFAIGEELASKWAFLPYLERGLANFVRVDVSCVGGLTEAKKVAGWAEAHYVDLVPHNPIGPVCTAATVHLAAACNNFAWTEINPRHNEGRSDLFPVQVQREGPFYRLPARPGLGVDMDERAVGRYAFEVHEHPHLRRPDGSYTNW